MTLNIQTDSNTQIGPLPPNFQFDLEEGYTALVGPNDSGKSAILQAIFRNCYHREDVSGSGMCLILPDRGHVAQSGETGGRTLESYNGDLFSQTGNSLIPYHEAPPGPPRAELPRVLLNHTNFRYQLDDLDKMLRRVGLPEIVLRGNQQVTFEEVAVHFHGTGLRSVLPILAALTDTAQRVILIDEPELGLEPSLQKAVRRLLMERSEGKYVVVATHSHLFLNRSIPQRNFRVERTGGGGVLTEPLRTQQDLHDAVFGLLGNSTQDLFFPGNYVIVEGPSDQIVIERVLELLGARPGEVKVLAAGGIDKVARTISSVEQALLPLVVNDSPYKRIVVALVDSPPEASDDARIKELRTHLTRRVFVLPESSLERYLPDALYDETGASKTNVLAALDEARGDYVRMSEIKTTTSRAIADGLAAEHLDQIPVIRDAAEKALSGARR
jgi:energy-coupling factor transporter ATP-binding protein EcfA2